MSGLKPFVVGIDPGRSGAYCVLGERSELIEYGLCPVVNVSGKKHENWSGMSAVLRGAGEARAVFIERVQAGPVMGKHSTMVLGQNAGMWIGMAASFGFRTELVAPKTWQGVLLCALPGNTKKAAVVAAGRLWPVLTETLEVKAKQGIADAALIAEYGRRVLLGGM